jgi:hypothetical protein
VASICLEATRRKKKGKKEIVGCRSFGKGSKWLHEIMA